MYFKFTLQTSQYISMAFEDISVGCMNNKALCTDHR